MENNQEAYIKKFVKKHGYAFSYWIGEMEIACFIDQYFFNFEDIKADIDNKAPKDAIFEQQDKEMEEYWASTP